MGQDGFQKRKPSGALPRSACCGERKFTHDAFAHNEADGGRRPRSSLLGIVINLTLALVKCLTGLIGHSFALLADGIESFLDVISSSVVYYGLRLAIKPPDKDHPYGMGRRIRSQPQLWALP